jgi:hypothetical protein
MTARVIANAVFRKTFIVRSLGSGPEAIHWVRDAVS